MVCMLRFAQFPLRAHLPSFIDARRRCSSRRTEGILCRSGELSSGARRRQTNCSIVPAREAAPSRARGPARASAQGQCCPGDSGVLQRAPSGAAFLLRPSSRQPSRREVKMRRPTGRFMVITLAGQPGKVGIPKPRSMSRQGIALPCTRRGPPAADGTCAGRVSAASARHANVAFDPASSLRAAPAVTVSPGSAAPAYPMTAGPPSSLCPLVRLP